MRGPTFYTINELLGHIRALQVRVAELESLCERSMRNIDDKVFYRVTGFLNARDAAGEFEKAGGENVFGSARRDRTFLDPVRMPDVRKLLHLQFPRQQELVDRGCDQLAQKLEEESLPRGRGGAPPAVDAFHLFLIPFVYIYGGLDESLAPILPGISVSQSHFSRLLRVSAHLVLEKWVPLYYCKRDLAWLCSHCGPNHMPGRFDRLEPQMRDKLLMSSIVLLIDGATFLSEKSGGGRQQKHMYDWSKDSAQEARVLLICDLYGRILHVSPSVGGRTFEVEVAATLQILEDLNSDALASQVSLHVTFVVDRGFRDFVLSKGNTSWSNLTVDFVIPHHLNVPGKRGHRKTAEEKAAKRKQHDESEVQTNRSVASVRWINEWSVGALKHCRLFHRLLDLTILPHFDTYLEIAAAISNYHVEKRNK
jgi:hypothetical protein